MLLRAASCPAESDRAGTSFHQEAIPYLTRPDFVPKVLAALFPIPVSAAASVTEERWTPAARAALLLKFLRTARPPLNTPEDLERQVESLCWVRGVAEAWALVRKFGDEEKLKERLVWRVLEHCFSRESCPAQQRL